MTPEQLAYVKRLLGAYACEFTDKQLNQLHADAVIGGAANVLMGAAALGFYELATGAVTLTNFRQGETQENEAVIFDRLWNLFNRLSNQAGFPAPLPTYDLNVIRMHYIDFEPEETE